MGITVGFSGLNSKINTKLKISNKKIDSSLSIEDSELSPEIQQDIQ
jgi:hypothetical protein